MPPVEARAGKRAGGTPFVSQGKPAYGSADLHIGKARLIAMRDFDFG
jgi:hypothetical protein